MEMRTKKPEAGNKFYNTKSNGGYSTCIQGKPTDKGCNVLANCVGYACGRFNEIIGEMKYPSLNCNAENFIERAKNTYGLEVGQTPKVGAIMCWQHGTLSGSDGAGHVAIVEKVISDTEVYTSESSYGGAAFFNATRKKGTGKWGISNYTFRGFIYNPAIKPEPTPTPTPSDKFNIGDKVVINGALYVSSTASSPAGSVSNKVTNITRKAQGTAHPYNTTGDLGWMDESSISAYVEPTPTPTSTKDFKVGDKVVPIKLVDYKGTHLTQYDKEYTIMQIDKRGAVLGASRKGKLQVWAVLKLDNIKKVG